MADRVTIQDIADALGLSRNTVSKAINNTGVLAEATRERVLQKAMEMGYKTFSFYPPSETETPTIPTAELPPVGGEIALFMGRFISNSHFSSTMLDKFQHELALLGYSLSIHRVTEDNFQSRTLPLSFFRDRTSAIMCLEIFDREYCKLLEELQLPLLLVDAPIASYASPVRADILLMQNTAPIFQLVKQMKERGIKKLGFIGEQNHCRSFFERFMAFRDAMFLYELPVDPKFCLTTIHPHDEYHYKKVLARTIAEMEELPELFICANDFVALDLLDALRARNLSVPDDILVFGFDDSQESKIITPKLSTCHIHSQIMGYEAVQLLMSRIKEPDLNYRIVHTETDLILRESTEGSAE